MKPFLYDRLFHSLLLEIASGYYPPGTAFLSLRKVVKSFRVCKMTAATTFQQLCREGFLTPKDRSGYLVTNSARAQAMLIIHESSLQSLPAPSDWRQKRSQLKNAVSKPHPRPHLAVIYVSPTTDTTLPIKGHKRIGEFRCALGCSSEAARRKAELSFASYSGDEEKKRQLIEELSSTPFDGILLIQRAPHTQAIHEILTPSLKKGVPIVHLFDSDNTFSTPELVRVDFNNLAAGYNTIRILAEHNHRRILVLQFKAVPLTHSQKLRAEGTRLAARDYGLTLREETWSLNRRQGGLTALLRQKPLPDAIVSFAHDPIVFAHQACKKLNLSIPRDLSLINFSSIPTDPETQYSSDVMKMDFDKAGATAVSALLDIIEGKPVHRNILVDLPFESHGTTIPRRD